MLGMSEATLWNLKNTCELDAGKHWLYSTGKKASTVLFNVEEIRAWQIEQTARSHWISHGSTASVSKKEKLAQKERDLSERQADVLEEVRDYWANTYQGIDSKKIQELCSDHFDSPKKALSTLKQLEKHGLLLSSKTSLEGKGDVRLFKPYVYPV